MAHPRIILPLVGVAMALWSVPVRAQGVVLDQGAFAIRIGDRRVGTEEFAVRRAGLGRDDAVFANARLTRSVQGGTEEAQTLLRARPPEGVAEGYQIRISGPERMDLQLTIAGRRYVAVIRSSVGEEDREFPAHADTRVLDPGVAHQYYFLRDLRVGAQVHALVPRERREIVLTVTSTAEVDLQLGRTRVQARRVDLETSDGDRRMVWFDRLGRVLRVEIPAVRYVAERTDLIG